MIIKHKIQLRKILEYYRGVVTNMSLNKQLIDYI